jgi:hypothetical protein
VLSRHLAWRTFGVIFTTKGFEAGNGEAFSEANLPEADLPLASLSDTSPWGRSQRATGYAE